MTVTSFVYCIKHHERKAVKIGTSSNPRRRFRQLQTGSSDPLTLFDSMPGDRILEQVFHEYFADRRLTGEWFDNSDNAVSDVFGRVAWEKRMAQ